MESRFLGLRTCIYKVSDLQEATRWYTKAFGKGPYFEEAFYVGFTIGGFELGLQPEDQPGSKGEGVVAYWGTDHIQSAYEALLKIGAKEHEPPHEVGGDIWVATVKDPWENCLGLIYNPHFQQSEGKGETVSIH
jgi:predicted enzyme related to lactoylglutathione lyase